MDPLRAGEEKFIEVISVFLYTQLNNQLAAKIRFKYRGMTCHARLQYNTQQRFYYVQFPKSRDGKSLYWFDKPIKHIIIERLRVAFCLAAQEAGMKVKQA